MSDVPTGICLRFLTFLHLAPRLGDLSRQRVHPGWLTFLRSVHPGWLTFLRALFDLTDSGVDSCFLCPRLGSVPGSESRTIRDWGSVSLRPALFDIPEPVSNIKANLFQLMASLCDCNKTVFFSVLFGRLSRKVNNFSTQSKVFFWREKNCVTKGESILHPTLLRSSLEVKYLPLWGRSVTFLALWWASNKPVSELRKMQRTVPLLCS